jgi:hypothetical protein
MHGSPFSQNRENGEKIPFLAHFYRNPTMSLWLLDRMKIALTAQLQRLANQIS